MASKKAEAIAARVVAAIWEDMTDRSGFDLSSIDFSVKREIKKEWYEKILKELTK